MKACILFAGQSVQETGMCRELWKNKAAREVLERLKPTLGRDLEYVTTEMPEEELALTFNAQRAIHAHHLGHWFAYQAAHPDIELDGAVGHSMGVVAALAAAGAMSVEDSGVFIRARAQVFSDVCKTFKEPMGLAAVMTDFVADYIEKIDAFPGVSFALHNTIGRGTAGGRLADLSALARHAESEAWPVKIMALKVEGPYHTAAFKAAQPALLQALAGINLAAPKVPVFMGTSGKLETEPARIARLLAEQPFTLEKHFDAVWAAYGHGCRNFLEVAYKPQPVGWIKDQLVDEDGKRLPDVAALAVKTADIGP
ncbi:MAG: ACP S-malonyltransferase [Elusimicrobia bacterium]|nr:ACP S-malonyltransferase [Elusimicrobiota bacterium]